MTDLLNRLGSLGVLLIASALIVGGLAGAAIAHHYETVSTQPAASHQPGSAQNQQGDANDQQGEHSDRDGTRSTPKPAPKATPIPKKPRPIPSASPKPKASASPKPSQETS